MAPAVPETPEGVNTMRFGVLKFARFSRLKISARNCSDSRSRNAGVFDRGKIPGRKPRPGQGISSQIAIESAVGRRLQKCGGIEPLRRSCPRIAEPVKFGFTNGRTGLRVSPLFEGL